MKSSQEGLSEAETASNSSPTKVTEGIYHESLDKIWHCFKLIGCFWIEAIEIFQSSILFQCYKFNSFSRYQNVVRLSKAFQVIKSFSRYQKLFKISKGSQVIKRQLIGKFQVCWWIINLATTGFWRLTNTWDALNWAWDRVLIFSDSQYTKIFSDFTVQLYILEVQVENTIWTWSLQVEEGLDPLTQNLLLFKTEHRLLSDIASGH